MRICDTSLFILLIELINCNNPYIIKKIACLNSIYLIEDDFRNIYTDRLLIYQIIILTFYLFQIYKNYKI